MPAQHRGRREGSGPERLAGIVEPLVLVGTAAEALASGKTVAGERDKAAVVAAVGQACLGVRCTEVDRLAGWFRTEEVGRPL